MFRPILSSLAPLEARESIASAREQAAFDTDTGSCALPFSFFSKERDRASCRRVLPNAARTEESWLSPSMLISGVPSVMPAQ